MYSLPRMEKERRCLNCNSPIYGRPDKLFCSDRCRDNWHNIEKSLLRKNRSAVLGILEKNYGILISLMKSECRRWPLDLVEGLGFKSDYFTRITFNKRGGMVCECFNIRYSVSKTKIWNIEFISTPLQDRRDLRL